MNSYQKLKAENKQLRHKLRTVCLKPNSLEAISITFGVKIEDAMIKAIFFGDASKEPHIIAKTD